MDMTTGYYGSNNDRQKYEIMMKCVLLRDGIGIKVEFIPYKQLQEEEKMKTETSRTYFLLEIGRKL